MIADEIKKLRKEHGLTQGDLARICQVSRITVSLWENGHVQPNEEHLFKILKYFDIDEQYFIAEGIVEKKQFSLYTNLLGLAVGLFLLFGLICFHQEKIKIVPFEDGVLLDTMVAGDLPDVFVENVVMKQIHQDIYVCIKLKDEENLHYYDSEYTIFYFDDYFDSVDYYVIQLPKDFDVEKRIDISFLNDKNDDIFLSLSLPKRVR